MKTLAQHNNLASGARATRPHGMASRARRVAVAAAADIPEGMQTSSAAACRLTNRQLAQQTVAAAEFTVCGLYCMPSTPRSYDWDAK